MDVPFSIYISTPLDAAPLKGRSAGGGRPFLCKYGYYRKIIPQCKKIILFNVSSGLACIILICLGHIETPFYRVMHWEGLDPMPDVAPPATGRP
jgi:hypothetical protein